jgi:hypothetical protein
MSAHPTNGYTVYCDESRHDGSARNPYLAIGGLWVPTAQKAALTKELRALLKEQGLGAELKWSKVSEKKFAAYQAVIDFFFTRELRFRVILVEQAKLKYGQFKDGDGELGFYTFYYEMLVKWLRLPVVYNLLLDFKNNKAADRHQVLERCLKHKVPAGTTLSGVHVIDSADSPLAQLADILIGATAATWCDAPADRPKGRLAAYIAQKAGRNSLNVVDASPVFSKINLFKIDLQ